MARLKPPPSKGRVHQKMKVSVGRAIRGLHKRAISPDRHAWLVRHMERQNGRCAYCGIPMLLRPRRSKEADRKATLEHVIPLSRNGRDSEENTVAACAACNSAKAITTAAAFRMSEFLKARKALAAKVRERKPLVVETVHKRERTKEPAESAATSRAGTATPTDAAASAATRSVPFER
jgi:5-methylcytosine-specific restriction endonuclease McrA